MIDFDYDKALADLELTEQWRYQPVGDNTWRLDVGVQSPEDEWIARIDGEGEEQEGPDLHALIEQLPTKYQELLWDILYEGLTLQQAGQKRGYTKQAAWANYERAKKYLRRAAGLVE